MTFPTNGSGRAAQKVIVVTAGYGDIGRATCRRLCEEGATVIMTGRKPLSEGAAIARQTQAGLGSIEYLRCDSGDRASIDALFAEVLARHPRIDVVIGNAAMVENGAFLDIRPDQWQAHLDLNLTGNFHLGQAAARIMARQEPIARPGCERGVRGKILFNGSWCQDMPWPEGCCYGVAKAGLAFMARAMAQELAVHGIRVNVVAPGIIMAGLSKVCYETDPNYAPRATAAIPLREFGTPEQCADAFLFLASDESDYITGISLTLDGGASLPRRD
jgi:NAD(P)-dependent dehydrogenase (short-subunit alcohol dehydrogenase family)